MSSRLGGWNAMSLFWWLVGITLVVNIATLAIGWVVTVRAVRQLQRLEELDSLLSSICVAAFAARAAPIWQAWSETMGSIQVEVSAMRRPWQETGG
jgi:hypothetical protein